MSDVVVLRDTSPVLFDVEGMGAPGPVGPAGDMATVATKASLAALSVAAGAIRYLTEAGSEGVFVYSAADLSAQVAADTYQGIYIAPASDTDGSSGAWVRTIEGETYYASWFGFNTTNLSTNHLRLRSIEAVRTAGSTVVLPSGDFTGFYPTPTVNVPAVTISKSGRWTGQGRLTKFVPGYAATSGMATVFAVFASDLEIDNMFFSGFQTIDDADSQFCIAIGTRHTSGAVAGGATDRLRLHDLWFDDCDNCIRAIRSVWAGPINYSPTHLEIWNVYGTDVGYQFIVPWCDEVSISNFYCSMKAGITIRPFSYPFRVIGCNNVRITNGRVHDPLGVSIFGIMAGGVDGIGVSVWNNSNEVYISDVVMSGIGNVAIFKEMSGSVVLDNCNYTRDLSRTDEQMPFIFSNTNMPMSQSSVRIKGGAYRGFTGIGYLADGNFKHIVYDGVDFCGNSRTAGFATSSLFPVQCSAVPTLDALGNQIIGLEVLEVVNCRMLFRDSMVGFGIIITDSKADTYFSARECVFPFGVATQITATGAGTVDGNATNRTYPANVAINHIANRFTNPRNTSLYA